MMIKVNVSELKQKIYVVIVEHFSAYFSAYSIFPNRKILKVFASEVDALNFLRECEASESALENDYLIEEWEVE